MFGVAIVLFTLDRFDSPALAGIVTFASVGPGLIVSPIAGALLDRHGRARLIVIDQLVGAASLILIAGLALGDALTPVILILVTAVAGLTAPLSSVGLRTLFPLLVPEAPVGARQRPRFQRLRHRDPDRAARGRAAGPAGRWSPDAARDRRAVRAGGGRVRPGRRSPQRDRIDGQAPRGRLAGASLHAAQPDPPRTRDLARDPQRRLGHRDHRAARARAPAPGAGRGRRGPGVRGVRRHGRRRCAARRPVAHAGTRAADAHAADGRHGRGHGRPARLPHPRRADRDHGDHRVPQRPARCRAVHPAPAPDGPGLAGSSVRGVDVAQLHGLPVRRRHRRRAGRDQHRGRARCGGGRDRAGRAGRLVAHSADADRQGLPAPEGRRSGRGGVSAR